MEGFIRNVELGTENSLDLMKNSTRLVACSDGGADDGKGSFGWVLKAKDSPKVLLRGIGGGDGLRPSSYRCECAGVLSVMCVWFCLKQDGILGKDHKLTLFCDNEGVVRMTKKVLDWPNFNLPRDAPEADLLYCIRYMAGRCRPALSVEWVKSHQDEKDCCIADLPEEARLNIEADRLAGIALRQTIRRPLVELKAPAGCDIIINGASITSRRNKTIKRNIDRAALQAHVISRCGWTTETFDKVDWSALGAALASFNTSHQVSLVKICNNLLPMGPRLVYRDPNENPTCASCKQNISESFSHMLKCPCHADWLATSKRDMELSLIQMKTPGCLRKSLLAALFSIKGCSPFQTSSVQDDLLEIGKLELWRGRIPLSASQAFDRWKKPDGDDDEKLNGTQWSKRVVKIILQQILSLWWYRNKKRHGNDREEEAAIRRKKALNRCRALAKRVSQLKCREELFVPMETIQKWKTGMIVHYLNGAEPLADKCLEFEKNVARPMNKWDRTTGEVYDPP